MTQLNRFQAPGFKTIESIDLVSVKQFHLKNGIPVYLMEAGSQEVTKIDIMFPAGAVQAQRPLLGSMTNSLMTEGTSNMSSAEISEAVDYYGAYMGQNTNFSYAAISLFTLSKYIPNTFPVLEDVIKNAIFPVEEFNILLNKKKQEYLIDSQKMKNLAARKFSQVIFGEQHPYANKIKLEDFDTITNDQIKKFFKNHYSPQGCKIIISGQPGKNIETVLNNHFGGTWGYPNNNGETIPPTTPSKEKIHLIEKEEAVQSALRIGRPIVTKNHPDYLALQIINTLLGGYFGSRLMANIREKKGLTYGISSFIASFKEAAFWAVSTEVMAEKREIAVTEIFKEFELLQTEKVGEEELTLVKNYMLGELLRNLDGPFAVSDNLRGLLDYQLDLTFYQNFVRVIKDITPEKIQQLAIKYLNKDDFYIIIAGK